MNLKRIFHLLAICCVTNTVCAQEPQVYNIEGIVKDSISQEVLPGAYISIGKNRTISDKEGKFTFKDIPAGKVKLSTSYYSSYPNVEKTFLLKKDTIISITMYEDILNLNQVVVTGTRTEKKLSNTPILTSIINKREIKKAGAVSTLESLQDNVPGIVVSPNAMGNNMRIKGLNSRYILFLVDGERLISEGAGGNVNLDQINVGNIEKIEVVNGASSALYGSNAVGAIINIITKKPVHNIEAGANLTIASHNTLTTQVYTGINHNKLTSKLYAFRNSSDGFGGNSNGAYAARYRDLGANFKTSYSPINRFKINFNGRAFQHETFNPDNSLNVSHSQTETYQLGANSSYTSSDKRNSIKLSVNWDKYFDYDILEKKNDKKSKQNDADYISSRLIDTYKIKEGLEIIGGMEFNYNKIFAIKTLGLDPTSKSINDGSLFAQIDWKIIDDLDIVLGSRYTYNEQFKSSFNPKVSLMYSFNGFKLRAGLGSAFRAPSIKELYYDFDHQGMFWIYGNADLKAEKGLYSSLSLEYTKGLFNASISAYNNNIDNKITLYDFITDENLDEKHYKNVSSVTLKGFDISFSYIIFKELLLKGTYSYCDAEDNLTGLQLMSNVKNSGVFSVTWNGKVKKSPFSLKLSGRMNSPILYQEMITADDGSQSYDYEESKSYSIWKATLVKPIRLGLHNIDLTLKCDNIFGFKDTAFINPGRQYLLGIRYEFK